jgi:alpha-2-macroglobulin
VLPSSRKGYLLSAALFMLGLALAAGLFHARPWQKATAQESGGPFEVVELANRDFDGSPALALTFTEPLDARTNVDEHLQVFEMPPAPTDQAPRITDEESEGDDAAEEEQAPAAAVSAAVSAAASGKEADLRTDGGVLVKGAWVVGDNPRLLFFPHIKPQRRYVVRVGAGLAARSGQKLAGDRRYGLRTAAVAPAYYFASRGMVLPAKQNGGLPVVTVNVPEVDIQFLRVKPNQLPAFLDKVIAAAPKKTAGAQQGGNENAVENEGEGDNYDYRNRRIALKGAVNNWDLDTIHKFTDSVYSGRFVTEKKINRRSVTFIPVEELKELKEPGVYIAVMSQPNRFRYDYQVSYFYVSDLGLHTRVFAGSADAFVSSLTDGGPEKGVEISWLDQYGKVVARGATDADGRAHFAERPKDARVVLARQGAHISMIALKEPALDLSEFDIGGPPGRPVSLFPYSGRNLYRPGERFDLSVLARDADGRPLPAQPLQAILKRPDGKSQLTATLQPERAFGGYYRRAIELPADAPTGFWTIELRADPADKSAGAVYRFGVEEFLPERMKLELTSKVSAIAAGPGPNAFEIDVSGSYLYGAVAAGNQLLGVVQYERQKNPLARQLPGFEFGDSGEEAVRTRKELEQTVLDDAGLATVALDVAPVRERRSPFTVRATMSILESGGRPVVRSIERVYWPAPVLVGVRPLFTGAYARENSLAEFEVVRANNQAQLRPGVLPVRLFREDRNYYWRFEDQRGWHSGFTETDELVATGSVTVPAGGRGKLSLPTKYGRYRLELTDPETRLTTKYRFYSGWSAQSDETQGVRPDRVALKWDKPAYLEGEIARLTITPPHAGQALVTVEGGQTLWVKRLAIKAEGTTIDIAVDKQWLRHDLYVTAMVMRPGSEGEKVTPARALGLLHLPLARDERKLAVSLTAPAKMLPETPLKVKVRVPQAKGQQAMVTLSAVDVGILNITRFAAPDPHANFFGKLRYGADQYDVYGRLIEKMAGQKGKLKFGGDTTPKATKSLPKKVRLIDLFSGPVALNAQGEAEITLAVPDFNGTLRLSAVVATKDKFGSAEAPVIVASPLVAELSTPRFLTSGDRATVALDLHNLSGSEKTLTVSLTNGDGLKILNPQRSVLVKDQQKSVLRFPIEAGTAFGLTSVQVSVSGAGIKIARQFGLQVQAATPQQQIVRRFVLAPGESLNLKDADLGGFVRSSVQAHLVLSNLPPIDVRKAIEGLLTYPYGCAEQTTSTAYPHVFIDDEAARKFGLKGYTREQRADMLEKAIARLAAMQAPVGGFSLWGNVSDYEYWLSAYIQNFLLDAREQGFAVPAPMQQKASDFLLRALQEGASGLPSNKVAYNEQGVWRDRHYGGSGRFGVLAYGAYVLARESKAPLATLRQLFLLREQAHSGLALVHLGIALKLMGDDGRAKTALAEGVKKTRDDGYWWGDYGSPLRDAALSYFLIERHKLKVDAKDTLLLTVAEQLNRHQYTSTQEKLALFLAGREMAVSPAGSGWSAALTKAAIGTAPERISANGAQVRSLSAADLVAGTRIENTHTDKLYLELSLGGHPVKMPAARSDEIALGREMFDSDGKPVGARPLKVGETVLVKLHVDPRRMIGNGLVVDRIPAGLEIENLNLVQGESMASVTIGGTNPAQAMQDPRIVHVEFRDDRFVAAVRMEGALDLFYRARVVTPGKFVVPPLYAEDMYRPDVYGMAVSDAVLTVIDAKTAPESEQPAHKPVQKPAEKVVEKAAKKAAEKAAEVK